VTRINGLLQKSRGYLFVAGVGWRSIYAREFVDQYHFDGDTAPLPYVPLLNPLISTGTVLLVLLRYWRS